jgi:hypothetical protein
MITTLKPWNPETLKPAKQRGVALLMVIAVLAALMAISAPFVF